MNRALLAIAALWVLPAATGFTQPSTNNAISALMLSNGVAIPPVVSFGSVTNGTNVFQRAFGGEMEADRVVDRSATNWWAVFDLPYTHECRASNWCDVTIKASTNSFTPDTWGLGGECVVFRFTSADPAFNGNPSWESFSTNWQPRVLYWFSANEPGLYAAIPYWQGRNSSDSIHDHLNYQISGWGAASITGFRVVIRDTGQWFHPTNGLVWVMLWQNNTDSEAGPQGHPFWRPIEPRWVSFDPRPLRVAERTSASTGINWYRTNMNIQP